MISPQSKTHDAKQQAITMVKKKSLHLLPLMAYCFNTTLAAVDKRITDNIHTISDNSSSSQVLRCKCVKCDVTPRRVSRNALTPPNDQLQTPWAAKAWPSEPSATCFMEKSRILRKGTGSFNAVSENSC